MLKETLLKMWMDAQGETRFIDVLYIIGFILIIVIVGMIEGGVY